MCRIVLVALALLMLVAAPAAGDDDRTHFRRTTPRATLGEVGGDLVLGVPSGRAWGIESELRPLPSGRAVAVRLSVADDAVREAFVRVAYYASATGRPRQIAVSDSALVGAGEGRIVFVALDPPPGAVAYRVRVLARLRAGAERSVDEAIRARLTLLDGPEVRRGSLFSRLLPDAP